MPALSKFCIRGGCTKKPINETRLGCMTGRQEMMDAVRVERGKEERKKKRGKKRKSKVEELQNRRDGGRGQEKISRPKTAAIHEAPAKQRYHRFKSSQTHSYLRMDHSHLLPHSRHPSCTVASGAPPGQWVWYSPMVSEEARGAAGCCC